jgi:hypothetical protein
LIGRLHVIDVALTTVALVQELVPIFTVAPEKKFCPIKVSVLPPPRLPEEGEKLVMIGDTKTNV